MYQALLTRRYLTSKIMPLLSVGAVMLCTAMVLIVWSVMGGFLTMLLSSGRSLMGDVAITWPTTGFAHYEELVSRLEAREEVAGATPVIEAFGLIKLPDNRIMGVTIKGIDGPSYARVVNYEESLWWKPIEAPLPRDREGEDPRLRDRGVWERYFAEGMTLTERGEGEAGGAAAVLGIEVAGFSVREDRGFYSPAPQVGRRTQRGGVEWIEGFIADNSVTLHVLPMDRQGNTIDKVSRIVPVANEFRTGVYEIDSRTVLLRLDELQRMLKMDAAERTERRDEGFFDIEIGPDGEERLVLPETVGVSPARVTTVLVRSVDGVSPERLRDVCAAVYAEFERAHKGEVPLPPEAGRGGTVRVSTWKESQGTMVAAVEKEIALVLSILIFISMVASFLILAIFWAMVSEKTKDIGVLRSLGAGRAGIAWLWLRYGMAIGVLGAVLGVALATVIVWNINPIHEWLGRALDIYIWDPKVYYFSEIPHEVEPAKAAVVFAGAIAFSLLGALIPALRAAFLHPVEALRFE